MTKDRISFWKLLVAERADRLVCDLVRVDQLLLEVSGGHVAKKAGVGEDHIIADVTLVYRTLQKLSHIFTFIDKERHNG